MGQQISMRFGLGLWKVRLLSINTLQVSRAPGTAVLDWNGCGDVR